MKMITRRLDSYRKEYKIYKYFILYFTHKQSNLYDLLNMTTYFKNPIIIASKETCLAVAMMVVEAAMMSTPTKQIRVCSSHGTS